MKKKPAKKKVHPSGTPFFTSPVTLIIAGALFITVLIGSNLYLKSNLQSTTLFAFSSETIPSTNIRVCENTKQGKYYITDDRGYVCDRRHTVNGCCIVTNYEEEQYSCKFCNKTAECCTEYEFCVSCCLNPSNSVSVKTLMIASDDPILQSTSNTFQFCQARCRTSSKSILDKEYKSNHKFCYGIRIPTKDADFGVDYDIYDPIKDSFNDHKEISNIQKPHKIKFAGKLALPAEKDPQADGNALDQDALPLEAEQNVVESIKDRFGEGLAYSVDEVMIEDSQPLFAHVFMDLNSAGKLGYHISSLLVAFFVFWGSFFYLFSLPPFNRDW